MVQNNLYLLQYNTCKHIAQLKCHKQERVAVKIIFCGFCCFFFGGGGYHLIHAATNVHCSCSCCCCLGQPQVGPKSVQMLHQCVETTQNSD